MSELARDAVDGAPTRSIDIALLLLRSATGILLVSVFGWPKVRDLSAHIATGSPWPFVEFNKRVGLPLPVAIAWYQTLNETIGAALTAAGLLTRWFAASLAAGFIGATACSVEAGEAAWVIALLFAIAFATIAVAGPGRLSLDGWRHPR